MRQHLPLLALSLSVGLPTGPALASDPPATQPESQAPEYVREANMPAGFPEPGELGVLTIKTYPAHRAAVAQGRFAFGALFRHINRNGIKMTAPVTMPLSDPNPPATQPEAEADPRLDRLAMYFLYAKPDMGTLGPDPQDPRVTVVDVPVGTVASIAFRGSTRRVNLQKALDQLDEALAKRPDLEPIGPPRLLGYNGPSVPTRLRLNEIQRPVRVQAPATQPTTD